jgi:hypothetical protein
VFFPVISLHEEKVLLKVLIHFIVRGVGKALFEHTAHRKVLVEELIERLFFLQMLFNINLHVLIVLMKLVNRSLNLLYDVD